MTSQKSFCNIKMMKDAILESKYVAVLHLIVLFLATSLPAIVVFNNGPVSEYTSGELAMFLSGANPIMMIVAAALGFIVSSMMFSFLYSSSSTLFYHSMPYKRSNIYITRALAGIISLVLPYIIIFAVNSILFAYMNVKAPGGYAQMLQSALLVIGVYLVYFAVSTFASIMSGNRFAQFIIIAFVFFSYHLSLLIIQGNISQWFETYSLIIGDNYKYFIPPMMIANLNSRIGNRIITSDVVYCFVYALVFLCAGLFIYKHRRSENSNKFFSFRWLNIFLKYYITTFMALAFGLVFVSAASGKNVITGYITYLVFAFVGFVSLQAVFELNYKSMFKNLKQFAVYAVVFALVLTIPVLDVFNLEDRLPNPENKNKMSVYLGIDQGVELTFENKDNIGKTIDFLKKAQESNKTNFENYSGYLSHTAVTVSEGPLFSVKRHFNFIEPRVVKDYYASIYDSSEVKDQLVPLYQPEEYVSVNIDKYSYTTVERADKSLVIDEFVKSITKDIQSHSYKDTQDAYVYAMVHLASQGGRQQSFIIYSCYEETVKLLKKYGNTSYDYSEIDSLKLVNSGKKFESEITEQFIVTDKEQIREVIERTTSYHDQEGYEVKVGEHEYIGFISKDDLPAFLLSE
jgi:ABC-type transport system involved in multi-copper enzyme maturation permease subunit